LPYKANFSNVSIFLSNELFFFINKPLYGVDSIYI
jgi:hypothetical protein